MPATTTRPLLLALLAVSLAACSELPTAPAGGDGPLPDAASATDAREAIPKIVGLTADQFVKCVVLPQGEFSAFLHETESKRNDLLVRLLDLGVYEKMARAAGQRASELSSGIEIAPRSTSPISTSSRSWVSPVPASRP